MEEKKPRDMLTDLSDSRTFLMGTAILGIVLFHMRAKSICPEGALAAFFNDLVGMGYGGSDVFFFLSGFGIAWSLKRDSHYGRYLTRRAKKLFPAYYPFILLYILSVAWIRGITGKEILGNLTFIGFWFQWDNQFNWYIQSAMAFYLLAPAAYRVVEEWRDWRSWLLLTVFALALQVVFFGEYQMIAITRVPVFLLGLYLGTLEKGSMAWTRRRLAAVVTLFLGGLVLWKMSQPRLTWGNGLYWYPFLVLAPAGCLLTAALRPYWLRLGWVRKIDEVICLCGRCSYEIYLVHLLFFETILAKQTGNLFWLTMAVMFTALGVGYHFLISWAMRKWKKA